jgi:hypothetical protein
MKKTTQIFLMLCSFLFLFGCQKNSPSESAQSPKKDTVIVTPPPIKIDTVIDIKTYDNNSIDTSHVRNFNQSCHDFFTISNPSTSNANLVGCVVLVDSSKKFAFMPEYNNPNFNIPRTNSVTFEVGCTYYDADTVYKAYFFIYHNATTQHSPIIYSLIMRHPN